MSEVVPPQETPLNYPPIAMSVEFGAVAQRKELTYDIDVELVRDSLLAGGIKEEDLSKTAFIIGLPKDEHDKGVLSRKSPLNQGEVAIVLYSHEGDSTVSTKVLAHEVRHLADDLYSPEEILEYPFVRPIRKAAVTAIALAAAAAPILGADFIYSEPIIKTSPIGIAIDVALLLPASGYYARIALDREYLNRKMEKRARAVEEAVEDKPLLIIEHDGLPYVKDEEKKTIPKTVAWFLKNNFVPRFWL